MLRVEEKATLESFYSLRLKEWSRQIPVIKLSAVWEKNILDLVPREVQKRHPRRVELTLNEIRDIYQDDMRKFAIASIIPHHSRNIIADVDAVQEPTKQLSSKIHLKEKFLIDKLSQEFQHSLPRRRYLFGKKYFLSHSIMKHIMATANSTLPRVIVELKDYRKIDLFEITELEESLTSCVKKCAVSIETDYYRQVLKFITNYFQCAATKNLERKKFAVKLLDCATNLFAQQIIKIMINTIDSLIGQLADYRRQSCPRLKLKLVWSEDCLTIDPPISKIYSMWHSLINDIENIANRLFKFHEAIGHSGEEGENDFAENMMKINLPDWYVNKSHEKIDKIISEIVGPLGTDFDTIFKQFGAVPSMRKNITDLVSKNRNFDVYVINVKILNKHYEKANDMIESVDYAIGTLNQSEAKRRLKEHIVNIRKIIVDKLLTRHREFNLDICNEFKRLEDEMLEIPKEAEALFKLGEKIAYASKVLIDKLEKRVGKSIEMLSSLVEITSDITEEHIKLNAKTINWLVNIKPVFNKSNTLCEAMKSELEDELQRRINKLNIEIDYILPKFQILDDMDDATRVYEYAEHLGILVDNLNELDRDISRINFEERLFKFPETSFQSVEEIRDILVPYNCLNNLMSEWARDNAVWLDGPFEYIDAQRVTTKTLNYLDRFNELNASLKTKIKVEMQSSASTTNKPLKFSGVVDDPDPMQQPAPLKLCWQVLQEVQKFKDYLELIICLCNPALCERHWREMSAIYYRAEKFEDEPPIDIPPNAGTTLRKLIALDINKDIDKYKVISIGANKELELAQRLDYMISKWDAVEFKIVQNHFPSTFANLDEIQILIEEHSVIIREMKVSYFVKPIATNLAKFSHSLVTVGDFIKNWLHLQDEWFDLEPVFRTTHREIEHQQQQQMPGKLFFQVHETVEKIKEEIVREPNFPTIAKRAQHFLKLLRDSAERLEIVKECVKNYLLKVRDYYPRFYFISDRQLIEIIFEEKFSKKVKLLVNKCFTGIKKVRIGGEGSESAGVVSIVDNNHQELLLTKVEIPSSWLTTCIRVPPDATLSSFVVIERAIKLAVRKSILQSFIEYEGKKSISQLVECSILMATICGLRLHWSCKIEEAFLVDASAKLTTYQKQQSLLLKSAIEELRISTNRQRVVALSCLIIQLGQQQEITRLLQTENVTNSRDFNWKAQVRHYWRDNEIKVSILDTECCYGYEYSVSEKPIINTPLTDRCYRTLMEAHRNKLYGALFGPGASGKSQSIKSLARSLGLSLRVFNCHEKVINYNNISNHLKGLIGCSACWLSFKNLDLLTIKLQSTLAQQISALSRLVVSSTTTEKSSTVQFQGSSFNFRDGTDNCFISSTVSSIYSSKRQLTDSLKILFRPVAMTVIILPDRRRIIEIELFAVGFADAAMLAEKINLVEKYAFDQLNSIKFYDFSMRTTKSVIKTACALKIRFPDDPEDNLVLRALLDVHLPKLNRSDVLLFHNIIQNLFPRVQLSPPDYSQLLSSIYQIRRKELNTKAMTLKIIQMFEMLFIREAIIVVGPSLSGKTSIIDTLGAGLSLLDQQVKLVRINHIALSSEELFGTYEANCTGKLNWKDGIITRNLRSFFSHTEEDKRGNKSCWQWLILDGPLDKYFKLSTLLDSNKSLLLTSGERIEISPSTSVIIETTSIEKTCPSTISRCGIIYIDEDTIGLKAQIKCWIDRRRDLFPFKDNNEHRNSDDKYLTFLETLLESSLAICLTFVYANLSSPITRLSIMTSKNHMIICVLRLFEMYLRDAIAMQSRPETDKIPDTSFDRAKFSLSHFFVWTQAALVMAIVWGIGGAFDRESRIDFDKFCASIWRNKSNNEAFHNLTEIMKQYELTLPTDGGLIQDHVYIFSGTGSWRHYSDVLKKKDSGRQLFTSEMNNYVPTIESVKYINILEAHLKHRKPFILAGETATGKSLYIRYLVEKNICQSEFLTNFFTLGGAGRRRRNNCTGWSGKRAQQMFLSKINRVKIGVYGPGVDRLSINFIDDLHVANSTNSEEEVAALELIRQFYDNDEWYQVDTGEKIKLSNVMFIGALSQDRSNEWRNDNKWREPRFFRHFNIYTLEGPSNESIFNIYSNILLTNFRNNLFNADVSGSVTSIVNATIQVYSSVKNKLKPVPSKFQYQFGLRDVARVITGCSLIHKESVETKITLTRLWFHETLRVFADRIIDTEDADWLFATLRDTARSHFKDSFEAIFDNLPKNEADQLTRDSFKHLIFSDFMQTDLLDSVENSQSTESSTNRKRYEELSASCRQVLTNKAVSYLNRYNETRRIDDESSGKKLDILILSGLLEHLLRIVRVIGMPGGNLLMICFGASGRRSLTALAAHIKGQRLEELSSSYRVSSSLGADPWRDTVKKACTSCIADAAGPNNVSDCTFFITERQIFGSNLESNILADIWSLMTTGKVEDLFTTEERDDIIDKSRLLAQKGDRNLEMSSLAVIEYFYNKCQEKLHFVLYFNRANERKPASRRSDVATKITIFNSILSHCTVDCYEAWPEEAFYQVAKKFISGIEIDKDIKSKAILASKYFYDSVENNCSIGEDEEERLGSWKSSLPKCLPVASYVHMVSLYEILMSKRQIDIRGLRKRYLSGLEKLELAGDQVREMQAILTRLRPQLEQSAKETADTMEKIERENVSVENATIQVKREEQVANRIAQVAGILKEECEADLAVAIPILEDAVAALNTLKPTDITLVKAMKNPPDTVKLVLAAVCVMLNVPPDRSVDPVTGKKSIDYWAPSKRILGDMNFLQNLKDYDKDNIPTCIMQVVNKTYMTDENFMPHIVAKASSAAEGLCKWVRAMVSYDEVAKVVAPKKEKLAAAEKECNASLAYLNEKRMSLAALNDKLAALNGVLEATLDKKLKLENQVANCTNKLIKAEGLITSLAGEKSRWLDSAESLGRSYDCLAGDILLSSGLVALLPIMDANDRQIHLDKWTNRLNDLSIPNSGDYYDFVESLETEIRITSWHNFGLSNNSFSHGNATIVENSLLWPLFIDPQNEANTWIRQMESPNKLKIVKGTDRQWLEEIEASFDENLPVLVENLEQSNYVETTAIDYLLLHLCPRFRYLSGSVDERQRGRSSSNFRLYITSRVSLREARANLGSHIWKLMSVINFSLTEEALENRLLEIVVSRDKPELQETYEKLMAESATNKRILRQEEDKILTILSSSSVNIVQDERAIETLDYSKNLSIEIMIKEEAARVTSREMEKFRATYRSFTNYCAALYETLTSLTNLNHMYRFSLDWFTRIFLRSIDTSMKSVVLDKRLNYLKASFTETLHSSVRNALLDKHKLVYSFLLSIQILINSRKITREEVVILAETALYRRHEENFINPIDESKIIFDAAERLSKALPNIFKQLPESLKKKDVDAWRYFRDKNKASLPNRWNDNLTEFQKLILTSVIKPDKTISKIIEIVETSLETRLDLITQYSIARSFDESSCLTPLLFILPSYIQVYKIIAKWAKIMGYSSKVSRFSMLGGSNEAFEVAIEKARNFGGWIIIEDCHLADDDSLGRLEKISESLDPSNTVLSFRLWLTSYPTRRFPISVLHKSVKIHSDLAPSDSLKKSLLRVYQSEPFDEPDFYNSCPGKNKIFAKLVYSLSLFHTIVRGREKFGKRGWNVIPPYYQFLDSDFKLSIEQLIIFLNETCTNELPPTNYEPLVYLVGECYYGGRIFDPLDRILVNTILRDYCNPRVAQATPNYVFAVDNQGERYSVPNRSEYHDYIKHINESIPIGDSPAQLFSLDENAATLRDEIKARNFNNSLSLLFIDYVRVGKKSRSFCCAERIQDVRRILSLTTTSTCQQSAKKQKLDVERAKKKYPIHAEPLNGPLIEEIEIYNNLIELIDQSIIDLERTYEQGLPPLFLTSTAIDCLAESLVVNNVPLLWISITNDNNRSLSQFINYLPKRREFLQHWMETGHEKAHFWLGGMVFCNKFMSACRLMLGRKSSALLYNLSIKYEVLKVRKRLPWEEESFDDPMSSCFSPARTERQDKRPAINIHGLILSGARWDVERSTLVQSLANVRWNRMPTIRLTGRNINERDSASTSRQHYSCPLKTSEIGEATRTNCNFFCELSTNCIATVPLDSRDVDPEHWIKQTTALFCNTHY